MTAPLFAARMKAKDGTFRITGSGTIDEILQLVRESLPVDYLYRVEPGPDGTMKVEPAGLISLVFRVLDGTQGHAEGTSGSERSQHAGVGQGREHQHDEGRAQEEHRGEPEGSSGGRDEGQEAGRGSVEETPPPPAATFPPGEPSLAEKLAARRPKAKDKKRKPSYYTPLGG